MVENRTMSNYTIITTTTLHWPFSLTESRNDDLTKDEIINALSMTLSNMIENQQAPSDKENEQVCRLIFDTLN